MINTLFQILKFLAEIAWLIWPAAMLGDVVLSKRHTKGSWPHRSRWVARAIHSLTFAAVAMVFGAEFFWLNVVNVHYHGGWEILVVGPLVLYVSIRLSQRLDASSQQTEKEAVHSAVALWFPLVSAALLLLAILNSVTRAIPFLTDREPTLICLVPLLSLIAAGSISRCAVSRLHVTVIASLTASSIALMLVFFVAAGFKFFGFLPWGHANDDPWFYVLTGLVCFAILTVATVQNSRREPNRVAGD